MASCSSLRLRRAKPPMKPDNSLYGETDAGLGSSRGGLTPRLLKSRPRLEASEATRGIGGSVGGDCDDT